MYCRQFFANDDFTMGIMQSKAEALCTIYSNSRNTFIMLIFYRAEMILILKAAAIKWPRYVPTWNFIY